MLKYIAPLISTLALASTSFAQDKVTKISGTAHLKNGQSVTGNIIEWNENSIQFSSQLFLNNVTFDIEEIMHVELDPNQAEANKPAVNERIDHTNIQINSNKYTRPGQHGSIHGSLAAITDTHISLNTWYAGKATVAKDFIHNLDISAKGQTVFSGPGKLKGWHNNLHTNYWKEYEKGLTINQHGNISRELDLPSAIHLGFDIEWKNSLNLSIFIYGDQAKTSYPQTRYELRTQQYQPLRINKYVAGRYQRLNQQELNRNDPKVRNMRTAFNQKNGKARYDIYLDPKKGTHIVYVNGIKYLEATEMNLEEVKLGNAIHLTSRKGANMRLSNLEIKKWSGSIPGSNDVAALDELAGKGQRFLLKNGDLLVGEIKEIKDGLMTVKTEDATFPIPVINMRKIHMGETKVKREPMQEESDIKAWFHDGGWIMLKPISLKNGKLKASHQAFGELDFDLTAFKKIDLNLDNKSFNRLRSEEKW